MNVLKSLNDQLWKTRRRKLTVFAIALIGGFVFSSCVTDADQASENVSKAAEQFEVARRIVFVNAITDKYLLEVTGFCNIEPEPAEGQLEVVCLADEDKTGFVKHFFGLSDNTPYFVEQLDPINVSTTRPRVIFKPESLIPNVDRP